jgi:triosephosphate isomerase (TIM)
MKKIPLIAGNWKMNKTSSEASIFIKDLAYEVTEFDKKIYLFVPFTAINEAAKAAEKSKIVIGAQNMNDAKKGAFTGEIAAIMLKEAGAEAVLLGHSERRNIFDEKDDFINKKLLRAIKDDLQPFLCVGEKEIEREKGETEEVLKKQLERGLKGVTAEEAENVVIAYEPVWAIGSGKVATPDVAQSAHLFIRKVLEELFGKAIAAKMYILYGGSVNGENISSLTDEKDIDGALVGGASLEVDSFLQIIKNT